MLKINFTSKSEEKLSVLLTNWIGMFALVIGMTAILIPEGNLLLFIVPENYESQGLLFALLGWGSIHEAKQQKRYSVLKELLLSNSHPKA